MRPEEFARRRFMRLYFLPMIGRLTIGITLLSIMIGCIAIYDAMSRLAS